MAVCTQNHKQGKKLFRSIKNYFYRTLEQECGIKCLLFAIVLVLTGILLAINLFFFHFQVQQIFPSVLYTLFPFVLFFYLLSLNLKKTYPYITLFFKTAWALYAAWVAVELLIGAVTVTPFPLRDIWFFHWDTLLGFSTVHLLNWTFAHPIALTITKYVYAALTLELIFFPFVLALLNERRQINVYFISIYVSLIIGLIIYYFFPANGPHSMIKDAHFTPAMQAVIAHFRELHHHLKLTTNSVAIVSFPSFHVIWAILMAYAFRNWKWIFYPIAAFNSLIILSTLTIGWHYLVDDIAGIIVVIISITIAEALSQKSPHCPDA